MTEPRKPNTPSGPGAPSRPDKPGNVHDSHEPICATLHLDQRKLPATVFEHIAKMAGGRRQRMIDAEAAWENFGKPGRDPSTLGSVTALIANNGHWIPYLKIAQLRNHWDQVVGPVIAQHSQVIGLRDGVMPSVPIPRLGPPSSLPDSAAGTYHQGAPAGVGRPQDPGNRYPVPATFRGSRMKRR